MVTRQVSISFAELIRRPLIEDYITLCGVSNPFGGPYIGNALWLSASLASVLRQGGIRAGADQLPCTSADGFTSGVPVRDMDFDEDRSQIRTASGPRVMATLRNLAITILRLAG